MAAQKAGWPDGHGRKSCSPPVGALGPDLDRRKAGGIFIEEGRYRWHPRPVWSAGYPHDVPITPKDIAALCAVTSVQGCPHLNSSNKLPEGAAPIAGRFATILCNGWTARRRLYPYGGRRAANWIGESSSQRAKHVFQNLGNGNLPNTRAQSGRSP